MLFRKQVFLIPAAAAILIDEDVDSRPATEPMAAACMSPRSPKDS